MSVKISISGDGLSYTTDTDIVNASRIIAFLNASSDTLRTASSDNSSSILPLIEQGYTKAPREFLLESNAKTNAQKILTFAKYHITKNGIDNFDQASIRTYFKKSGEPEPKNFSRDLKEAILQLYIYETDEDGKYGITEHGENVLSQRFPQETKKQVIKKATSSAKRNSAIKPVTEGVIELEYSSKLDGLIPYHKVSTKGDRVLWILYYTYINSIPELASTDIEYIASRLLDDIESKNLGGLTENNIKKAYMTKTGSGKFKILHDGVEYLKSKKEEKE